MTETKQGSPGGLTRRETLTGGIGLAALVPTQGMGATGAVPPGADGFDFLIGDWTVRHRRLTRRLAGSNDWQEFAGTSSARKILGGAGNIDDNWIDLPGGAYRAATVRTFDPATGHWSIWWFDGRRPAILEPPVVGGFSDGQGVFLADDVFEARPIMVRYIWSGIAATAPRWEQAFSPDQGKSWETNWVMEFSR